MRSILCKIAAVLAVLFAGLIASVSATLPAYGDTPPGRTGNMDNALGGNIYLTTPVTSDNSTITIHNGAFSAVNHDVWGGGKGIRLNTGAMGTWNNVATIFAPNVGYTATGRMIDVSIHLDQVRVANPAGWDDDCDSRLVFHFAGWYEDSPLYTHADGNVGVELTFTTTFYYHGTNTIVNEPNAEFNVCYYDIDVVGPDETYPEWAEQMTKISGYMNGATIRNDSTLGVSSDYRTYYATAEEDVDDPNSRTSVIFRTTPQYTTRWRGYAGCGTGVGLDTKVKVYPDFGTPTKSPSTQTVGRGQTCSDFVIDQTFPYVGPDNVPSSVTVTDNFESMFDLTNAYGEVWQGSSNVSNKWNFSKNASTGQVTFSAKNTAHGGGAEGSFKFYIKGVKIKNQVPPSSYSKSSDGEYWLLHNKVTTSVSATYGGGSKTSNTVEVKVPRPRVTPQKSVNQPQFNVSDTATYSVKVTQTAAGAIADNITIVDNLAQSSNDMIANGATFVNGSLEVRDKNGNLIPSNKVSMTWNSSNKFSVTVSQPLAQNEFVTISYKVKMGETTTKALQKKSYTNRVAATCNDQATAQASNPLTSDATVYVREPKMVTSKTLPEADKYVDAGDTITYTFTASNIGGDAGSIIWNAVLVDDMPAQFIHGGASVLTHKIEVIDWNGTNRKGDCDIVWNGTRLTITSSIDIPDGKTLTVRVPVRLGDRHSTGLSGRTFEDTLTSKSDNSNTATDTESVTVSDPSLVTDKVALDPIVNTSESATCRVTTKNNTPGSIAYNVQVSDRLGANAISGGAYIDLASVVVKKGKSDGSNTSVITQSCAIGRTVAGNGNIVGVTVSVNDVIAYDEMITVEYDVVAGRYSSISLQDDSILNTAWATASNSRQSSNHVDAVVEVYTPELTIVKTCLQPVSNVGDKVPYKIEVTQNVPGAIAWDVKVIDVLDSELLELGGAWDLSNMEVLAPNGEDRALDTTKTFNSDNTELVLNTPVSLAYQQTMTVTYDIVLGQTTTRALQGKTFTNHVTASARNTRKDVSDDADVHVPVPEATARKSVDHDDVNPTDRVVYTLVAENTGEEGSCLRNVIMTDTFPSKMLENGAEVKLDEIVAKVGGTTVTPKALTMNGNVLTIEIAESIYTGRPATVTVPVVFGARDSYELCSTMYENVLGVSSDNADPSTDTALIYVLKPNLKFEKTAKVEKANISDRIPYEITIANTAPGSLAYDPHVEDNLTATSAADGAYIDTSTFSVKDSNGATLTDSCTVSWERAEDGRAIGYKLDIPYDLDDSTTITITYTGVSGSTDSVDLMKDGMDNTASVYVKNNPDPQADTATVKFYSPKLEIVKTADKAFLNAGDSAEYTLSVKQTEEGAIAWNVTIEDALTEAAHKAGAYIDTTSYAMTFDGSATEGESLDWKDYAEEQVKVKKEKTDKDEDAEGEENASVTGEDPSGESVDDQEPTSGGDEDAGTEQEEEYEYKTLFKASGFTSKTGIDLEKDHEIKISYTVYAGDEACDTLGGTTIKNVARAVADNFPEGVEDSVEIEVPDPALRVIKEADKHVISTYDSVHYKVAVDVPENNAVARNVTAEDSFLWQGPEGAVDAEAVMESLVITQDGKDITKDCETSLEDEYSKAGAEAEGEAQKLGVELVEGAGLGSVKISIDFKRDLEYGSVVEINYDVDYGNRDKGIQIPAQVVENTFSAASTNGKGDVSKEKAEIVDATLKLDKKATAQDPSHIYYSVDVEQVRENAVAIDPVIEDELSMSAVIAGVSLNRDVKVSDLSGNDVTGECTVTYKENAGKVIGYKIEIGDLFFEQGVHIEYSADATTLDYGYTEVRNTARAYALNADGVMDEEMYAFDGGVAPDLIEATNDDFPLVPVLAVLAAGIVGAWMLSVARRKHK